MALDLDSLRSFFNDFIDELPTEAVYRAKSISVRIGENSKAREMLSAGFTALQPTEVLMKTEDAELAEPSIGETLTIGSASFKIATITPLVSLSDPVGYRLTVNKTV